MQVQSQDGDGPGRLCTVRTWLQLCMWFWISWSKKDTAHWQAFSKTRQDGNEFNKLVNRAKLLLSLEKGRLGDIWYVSSLTQRAIHLEGLGE